MDGLIGRLHDYLFKGESVQVRNREALLFHGSVLTKTKRLCTHGAPLVSSRYDTQCPFIDECMRRVAPGP